MKSAHLPAVEQARLQALYDYDVLDTEAEEVFDDLTQLASDICQTPIALISLVDPDRQWFKSKVGVDATETPRDIAFCAHAIHQREIFEVPDTLQDVRFFDNPLVTSDPNIRFYAGAQLVNPQGFALGTLCVISDQPSSLTGKQRAALEILSREVISQLELRRKVKQLEIANTRKTDFLSNISHELRTPLNAIVTLSQVLMDELKHKSLPEKCSQYLDHLDYSGKRLLDLVNSVLDLNKIEEGKMELQLGPTDSAQFFSAIAGMMTTRAEQKGVMFSLSVAPDVPKTLMMDESKFSQIMLNLISNGIKFTEKGKKVHTNIDYANGKLVLVNHDQGIGIAKQDQSKLFNKFQRVGNTQQEGTGLGLVITKGLVELMGGEIKLNSELGKGTLIKVTLPINAVAEQVTLPSLTQQFDQQAKVLVVEDNSINQDVATAVFASLGMQISLADSGEHALQTLSTEPFDIVFMDLHLPGWNGFESARRIKQIAAALPIVALSADAFVQHNSMYDPEVMTDYLTKPIERSKLVAVLNTYIPV